MANDLVHDSDESTNASKSACYAVQFVQHANPDDAAEALNVVRFNHKFIQASSKRSAIVTPSTELPGKLDLVIRDDDGRKISKYKYIGEKATLARDSYLMTLRNDEQKMILEPVTGQFDFNLRSVPWQADGDELIQGYSQIKTVELDPSGRDHAINTQSEDGKFCGEELLEPDCNNLFDYRHFLSAFLRESHTPSATPVATPRVLDRLKDRATERSSSATADTIHPATGAQKHKVLPRNPIPKVRVQRRASVKQSSPQHSDIDDSGLTIEFDNDSKSRKKQFLGTPLSGQPTSLRSLVNSNSPNSATASPFSQANASEYDETLDMPIQYANEEKDDISETNKLVHSTPSTSAGHTAPAQQISVDINDDDLEAELALALELAEEEEDDDYDNDDVEDTGVEPSSAMIASQTRPTESESESEEE